MLHWPQYCSPSLRTNQVGTTIERNLGESEIQQFGQVFLWFRSIRSTGWFQRDRASKTTRVSIYSWNIYLSLFVYPSMCLFISLGPSKYPEKWRFTWDNSSTLTIVVVSRSLHPYTFDIGKGSKSQLRENFEALSSGSFLHGSSRWFPRTAETFSNQNQRLVIWFMFGWWFGTWFFWLSNSVDSVDSWEESSQLTNSDFSEG